MDLTRLHAILTETTVLLPNGAAVDERDGTSVRVTDVFAMPHEADTARKLEGVHLELAIVGVDKAVAERRREDLIAILRDYPRPERLASGPSYMGPVQHSRCEGQSKRAA